MRSSLIAFYLHATLLIAFAPSGVTSASEVDFSGRGSLDIFDWLARQRETLRSFIQSDDLSEDLTSGRITPQPGSSESARVLSESVNAARMEWLRRILDSDPSIDEADYIQRWIADYWGGEAMIPQALDEHALPVLRLAGADAPAKTLFPKLVTEFLVNDGIEKDSISVRQSESSAEIRFRRSETRRSELILISFCDPGVALTKLSDGDCDIAILDRPVAPRENLRFRERADFNLPAYLSTVALDGIVVFESTPAAVSLEELRKRLRGNARLTTTDADVERIVRVLLDDLPSGGSVVQQIIRSRLDSTVASPDELHLGTFREFQESMQDPRSERTIAALSLDDSHAPIKASRVSIRTNDYPLTYSITMAILSTENSLAFRFRRFAVSEAGQEAVNRAGYVGQGVLDHEEVQAMKEIERRYRNNSDYQRLIGPSTTLLPFVIRFNSGDRNVNIYSSLNADVRDNIERLCAQIARARLEGMSPTVTLVGHTDSDTYSGGNKELGRDRCLSVKKELEAMGISVAPITLDNSFAEEFPVASNESEEGKRRNRRVQLWLNYERR